MSQDPIYRNQQKSIVFWKEIALHYEEHRLGDERLGRSLESKWGTINDGVENFIGVY